jgi:hypothetical protein
MIFDHGSSGGLTLCSPETWLPTDENFIKNAGRKARIWWLVGSQALSCLALSRFRRALSLEFPLRLQVSYC